MKREAIILAGGLGTRLKGVVDELPKAMAPVNGKPFLFYLLAELSKASFSRVILATGYKSQSIRDYFGPGFKGMSLVYSVEEEPLGTGGAISLAATLAIENNIYILNGDTLFVVSFNEMEHIFQKSGSSLTVALKPMEKFDRYGSVTVNGDKIVSFNEKRWCERGFINGGVYLAYKEWIIANSPGEKFSFEKDILEMRVGKDVITGSVSDGFFLDIGIPADYFRASDLPQFR